MDSRLAGWPNTNDNNLHTHTVFTCESKKHTCTHKHTRLLKQQTTEGHPKTKQNKNLTTHVLAQCWADHSWPWFPGSHSPSQTHPYPSRAGGRAHPSWSSPRPSPPTGPQLGLLPLRRFTGKRTPVTGDKRTTHTDRINGNLLQYPPTATMKDCGKVPYRELKEKKMLGLYRSNKVGSRGLLAPPPPSRGWGGD